MGDVTADIKFQLLLNEDLSNARELAADAQNVLDNYDIINYDGTNYSVKCDDHLYTVSKGRGPFLLACDCQQHTRAGGICAHAIAVAQHTNVLHDYVQSLDLSRIVKNMIQAGQPARKVKMHDSKRH